MFRARLYFTRHCHKCRREVRVLIHDYGEIENFDDIDRKIGMTQFQLSMLRCIQCGIDGWPEYLMLYDETNKREVFRAKIGRDTPVVGSAADKLPYSNVRDPKEQALLDRGIAKMEGVFKTAEEAFWKDYIGWALSRWNEALKWLNINEWGDAYRELGIEADEKWNPAAFRKDAEKRFIGEEEKGRFWRAANRYLVYEEFLWLPPDCWPVEELIADYGKERVAWLVLNFPLPEELEKFRTEKIAAIAPKKAAGPQALLWERIRQLGDDLARVRGRLDSVISQLNDERRRNAKLEEELNAARREVERLKDALSNSASVRNIEDMRRVARLKALVAELRDENRRLMERLKDLSPAEEEVEGAADYRDDKEISSDVKEEDASVKLDAIRDKVIAVYGRIGEVYDEGPVILWHHGEKWDADAESAARRADILVILTRRCSHEVMWAAKEYCADTGKLIAFSRSSGVEGVIREACRVAVPNNTKARD